MPIIWRDTMSLGHKGIDRDHKRLIAILNEFEQNHSFETAQVAAKRLFLYTQAHFAREESLQRACGYPYLDAHKAEHAALLHRLSHLICEHFVEKNSGHEERAVIASGVTA